MAHRRALVSQAHPFIAVAGSIGSGKTTLTEKLVARLHVRGLYESTEANPYLSDFYGDMKRFALPLQLRFLTTRVRETREAQRLGIAAVQDRTCYEDAQIFAANLHERGAMDARDWETYEMLAAELFQGVEPPDLLVYLRRSPESCLSQIRKRGRSYEQEMPAGYLEELGQRYETWFGAYSLGAKITIEAADYDFLNNADHLEVLTGKILDALPQRELSFLR